MNKEERDHFMAAKKRGANIDSEMLDAAKQNVDNMAKNRGLGCFHSVSNVTKIVSKFATKKLSESIVFCNIVTIHKKSLHPTQKPTVTINRPTPHRTTTHFTRTINLPPLTLNLIK